MKTFMFITATLLLIASITGFIRTRGGTKILWEDRAIIMEQIAANYGVTPEEVLVKDGEYTMFLIFTPTEVEVKGFGQIELEQ